MVIAVLIEKKSMAMVSMGEGASAYEAKANAILECPPENWDIKMEDCEWELSNPLIQ